MGHSSASPGGRTPGTGSEPLASGLSAPQGGLRPGVLPRGPGGVAQPPKVVPRYQAYVAQPSAGPRPPPAEDLGRGRQGGGLRTPTSSGGFLGVRQERAGPGVDLSCASVFCLGTSEQEGLLVLSLVVPRVVHRHVACRASLDLGVDLTLSSGLVSSIAVAPVRLGQGTGCRVWMLNFLVGVATPRP